MNLPDKLNRKAVRLNFTKVSPESWKYFFDHEKENGLAECRTKGWGIKLVWYSTTLLMQWLLDHGHYAPQDFDQPAKPSSRITGPWGILASA